MSTTEDRSQFFLTTSRFCWFALKKVLWLHGMTPQSYIAYVVKLFVTGDQRLYDIMIEAKNERAKKEIFDIVHTDEQSLYVLMEQMRKQKER